jgi:hypothetical protein
MRIELAHLHLEDGGLVYMRKHSLRFFGKNAGARRKSVLALSTWVA